MFRFILFLCYVAVFAGPVAAQDRATIEQEFHIWLGEVVRPQAMAHGVSVTTFESAFAGVSLNWDLSGLVFPGMEPAPRQEQTQSEFRAPANYFRQNNLEGTAAIGREVAGRNAQVLATVEETYGVPGRIVLSIWARESGYGRVPITYNAIQVLSTRAYASSDDYMIRQLVAALEIAEAGHVPVDAMKSSWAGALGQPQFMPASYLSYAVDGDGDGRADIWGSDADTMASIANYLAVHGWVAGRDWGFEVDVPDAVSCTFEGEDQGRTIAAWEEMGVRRIAGRAFPEHELQGEGYLMMPAGRNGPAFIVTPNFYVLKKYNRSDLYALYVGHLGDRIEYGVGNFARPWGRFEAMYRSDIALIQQGLEGVGHDVGGADGLPGFKTRRSIGRWQESIGRPATCFPEPWMVGEFAQ